MIIKWVLIFLVFLFAFPGRSVSADYYIAQSAAGSGDGSSCANADALADLTWGQGNMVTAGDTLHLCGTLTSQLSIGASGASGNVITVIFETGAKFSAAYWGTGAAINCTGQSYIVIDGNSVGGIEATANGDALANQQGGYGVYSSCDNTEVKGLTISNIYVHVYNDETYGSVDTRGITFRDNQNSSAHNNTISHAANAITHVNASGATKSNISFYNNTVSYCSWGIQAVAGGNGSDTDNVRIYNNDILVSDNWMTPGGSYHNNGSYCYACGANTGQNCSDSGEAHIVNLYYYNNYFHTSTTHAWAVSGFIHADYNVTNLYVYNNLIVGDANGAPSGGGYIASGGGTSGGTAYYYSNTIAGNNAEGTGTGMGRSYVGNSGTLTMKNNIITGTQIGVWPGTGITIVADNNDYYGNTNMSFIGWENDGYATLTGWRTFLGGCPGTGNDCSAIASDPSLDASYKSDAADDPIVNTGADLGESYNTDKDGNSRPQGAAWDIGAYEYTSVPGTGTHNGISISGGVSFK